MHLGVWLMVQVISNFQVSNGIQTQDLFILLKTKKKQVSDQLFSKDATLVRVDIENINKIEDITPDFRFNHYYFVGAEDVCFNYALGDGSVIWKCSSTNGVSRISSFDSSSIRLENGVVLTGQRFLSYQSNIYESAVWMTHSGFLVKKINDQQDGLFHQDTLSVPLLTFNTGHNIKGNRVNGILQTGGSVLPGERYFLLNMYDDTVKGQILFDRKTGQYRKLPEDTQIHRNLNSTQYKDFVFSINNSGNSFKPNIGVVP